MIVNLSFIECSSQSFSEGQMQGFMNLSIVMKHHKLSMMTIAIQLLSQIRVIPEAKGTIISCRRSQLRFNYVAFHYHYILS